MDSVKRVNEVAEKLDDFPVIKAICKDLTNHITEDTWVSAPAAFGDTYKFSVNYTIGDYLFEYSHVSPETGEMMNPSFEIKKDDVVEEAVYGSKLYESFMKKYTGMAEITPSNYDDFQFTASLLLNGIALHAVMVPTYSPRDKPLDLLEKMEMLMNGQQQDGDILWMPAPVPF